MKSVEDSGFVRRCLRVLSLFCPPQLLEGIEGDLVEQYQFDLRAAGAGVAQRRFLLNVVRFFRYEIISRNSITLRLINTIMLGSYFKVAARNIQKRKFYSAVNAFGLSIGIAFCMLIWLFIQDEKSFDQFHENKSRIYRVEELSYNAWNPSIPEDERWQRSAYLQTGLQPVLKEELAEVEFATRFNTNGVVVKYGERVFTEDVSYIDGDFFRMFSFDLLQGSREKLFANTLEIVITPAIATKYFDDEDPMGKLITINDKAMTVAGVISPAPANSSFEYTMLVPMESRANYARQVAQWGNFNCPTFVQLRESTDQAAFNLNVNRVMDKHTAEMLARWRKEAGLPADFKLVEFTSSPLLGMHMNTEVDWHKSSDPQYSYILGGIALLILVIACINYISLALTTSASRRTEVGIRKVVGAQRNQLLYQFGFESIVLALISALVGIGLVVLFLPPFNEFTGKAIQITVTDVFVLAGLSAILGVFVGLIAGSYPALFLSRFRPALVLKGGSTTKLQAGFTRPLVVLQFALSAFLIISSLIMYQQMHFVASRDLGFDKEAVLVIPTQADGPEGVKRIGQLRTRLLQEDGVVSVGGTDVSFNQGWSRSGFKINGEQKSAYVYSVDEYYLPALNLELIDGRNFDVNIASDSDAVIVNEALVRNMKWENPVGEHYNWVEDTTSLGPVVIGVVKDYHYRSLESKIEPMMLHREWSIATALVKMAPGKLPETMDRISKAWKETFPDVPYNYSFLEDDLAKQYTSYERWIGIMGFSTAFAIVISCLGLFGLAGINAVNKTKEVGIRKVMGAELSSIFVLLNRQYIVLSMIAFALAIPVAYYVMTKWLSGFEFKIEMGWEIFVLSMLAGLVVSILTVSYHGFKAAAVNPAETLKYE